MITGNKTAQIALYKAMLKSFNESLLSDLGQFSLWERKKHSTANTMVIMMPATRPPLNKSPMELEVMVP